MIPSLDKKSVAQLKYMTFDTTVEKLRAYYLNDQVKLSTKEEELLERYQSLFHLLCNFHSNENAVKVHAKTYEITIQQAYRDLKAATDIFGDVFQTSREAKRYVVYEYGMKVLQLAAGKNPPDIAEMNKAIANIIKITGIDKDEFELPDASKIQPPTQILQINIDFLTSRFASVIDDSAKAKINGLMKQIEDIIDKNKIEDYLDKTIEVPYLEVKE